MTTPDKTFNEAKQLYMEQYGNAIVTGTYLKIALFLMALGLGACVSTQTYQKEQARSAGLETARKSLEDKDALQEKQIADLQNQVNVLTQATAEFLLDHLDVPVRETSAGPAVSSLTMRSRIEA